MDEHGDLEKLNTILCYFWVGCLSNINIHWVERFIVDFINVDKGPSVNQGLSGFIPSTTKYHISFHFWARRVYNGILSHLQQSGFLPLIVSSIHVGRIYFSTLEEDHST